MTLLARVLLPRHLDRERTLSFWRKLVPGRRPKKNQGLKSKLAGAEDSSWLGTGNADKSHHRGRPRSSRITQATESAVLLCGEDEALRNSEWKVMRSDAQASKRTFTVCLLIAVHGLRLERAHGTAQFSWLAKLLHCLELGQLLPFIVPSWPLTALEFTTHALTIAAFQCNGKPLSKHKNKRKMLRLCFLPSRYVRFPGCCHTHILNHKDILRLQSLLDILCHSKQFTPKEQEASEILNLLPIRNHIGSRNNHNFFWRARQDWNRLHA